MDISAATAAIQKTPSRATCLTCCHVSAGGGPGFKQGDIDPLQIDPPRTLDVHMASVANGGPGKSCLDCHTVTNHRFAGRGNDIRETDLNAKVECLDCHANPPHTANNANYREIDRHLARVHCTVCHIPAFARNAQTDMLRDFTKTEEDAASKRYEPVRTFATNQMPAYRWFNGLSYFYEFGKPITLNPGKYIRPIRWETSMMPTPRFTPLNCIRPNWVMSWGPGGKFRSNPKCSGKRVTSTRPCRQGAAEMGWNISGYSFANSQRYFSLYHEVAPKANALQCADCHVSAGRLNFKELGYSVKTTRNGQPLCSSCHEPETPDFYTIHNKHVRGESISCTTCHNFKTAPLLARGRLTLFIYCWVISSTKSPRIINPKINKRGDPTDRP